MDLWSLGQASLNVKRQAAPLEGMHGYDPPVSLVENITHVALMIIRLEIFIFWQIGLLHLNIENQEELPVLMAIQKICSELSSIVVRWCQITRLWNHSAYLIGCISRESTNALSSPIVMMMSWEFQRTSWRSQTIMLRHCGIQFLLWMVHHNTMCCNQSGLAILVPRPFLATRLGGCLNTDRTGLVDTFMPCWFQWERSMNLINSMRMTLH